MQLTVFFDAPFWVGVIEEERDGVLYAARYVFGAEPSAQDVYAFVLRDLDALRAQMSAGIPVEDAALRPMNPKRRQREIRRALARDGVSSRAHEAMRCQLEQNKLERHSVTREEREAQRAHERAVRRAKALKKRRGH